MTRNSAREDLSQIVEGYKDFCSRCGNQILERFSHEMHCFKPYLAVNSESDAFMKLNIMLNRGKSQRFCGSW